MSRKVAEFASVITTPLNVHNFLVSIPGLSDEALNWVVESSQFPTYKFREVVLWAHGEQVKYPGLPEGATDWPFTVPESDSGRLYNILVDLYKEIYDEKSGTMKTPKYRDIQVMARDLQDNIVFHVILHGAWFKGIDPVTLAATDPSQVWKWPASFTFSWIENIKGNNAGNKNPFANK